MSELHIDGVMNQVRIVNEKSVKERMWLSGQFVWVAVLFLIFGMFNRQAKRKEFWSNGASLLKCICPLLKTGNTTIQFARIPECIAEAARVGSNKTNVKF